MDSWATLLRVVLGFVLAYGVLPWVVLPRPAGVRTTLDAVVVNFLRFTALVIAQAYLLAWIGIYNPMTLLATLAVVAWFAKYRKRWGGIAGVLHKLWPGAHGGEGAPSDHRRARPKPSWRTRLAGVAMVLPVLGVLGVSLWLRLLPTYEKLALSPPDVYVHTSWAESFQRNDLFPEGAYPMGLAAFTSFLDVLTPFTDVVDVARFAGPILGVLLVFAIYYVVVRLTHNAGAALFAAGLLGVLGTRTEWRLPWHRQFGLLPQELGLVIAFLAAVFAVLAVTERGGGGFLRISRGGGLALGGNVLTVGLAALAAGLIHPLPAAFLVGLVGLAALCAALFVRGRFRYLVAVSGAAICGVVAGFAVIPFAELLGTGAYVDYGAADALADLGPQAGALDELAFELGGLQYTGHNVFSLMGAVGVAIAIVAAVALRLRGERGRAGRLLALAGLGLVAVAFWDVRPFVQLMDVFYVIRLTNILAPTLPLAFGAGLAGLGSLVLRRNSLVSAASAVVVGAAALVGFGVSFPIPATASAYEAREITEYESMARVTRRITNEFEPFTYTVVGLPQQRVPVESDGFFTALWVFARDIDEVPHDELVPIPTQHTFVFVELRPLPVEVIDEPGPNNEYYFTEKRGRVMAEVFQWAEERLEVDDDMEVYYSDPTIRVYRLNRNPALRVDPDDPLFKDYTYRPGELFNEGPTSPREAVERERGEALPALEPLP